MDRTKKTARKVERVLADTLIRNKIPFEFRKLINNKEVDFLIKGRLAVECDGIHHRSRQKKDAIKNAELLSAGYSIFRFTAKDVRKDINRIINRIKEWQETQES